MKRLLLTLSIFLSLGVGAVELKCHEKDGYILETISASYDFIPSLNHGETMIYCRYMSKTLGKNKMGYPVMRTKYIISENGLIVELGAFTNNSSTRVPTERREYDALYRTVKVITFNEGTAYVVNTFSYENDNDFVPEISTEL